MFRLRSHTVTPCILAAAPTEFRRRSPQGHVAFRRPDVSTFVVGIRCFCGPPLLSGYLSLRQSVLWRMQSYSNSINQTFYINRLIITGLPSPLLQPNPDAEALKGKWFSVLPMSPLSSLVFVASAALLFSWHTFLFARASCGRWKVI